MPRVGFATNADARQTTIRVSNENRGPLCFYGQPTDYLGKSRLLGKARPAHNCPWRQLKNLTGAYERSKELA
jgi:hypothetical protein